MNRNRLLVFFSMLAAVLLSVENVMANQPDSVYLIPYTDPNGNGRSGLRFAWSADGKQWDLVGKGYVYIRSDFGSQKHLISPYLFQDAEGKWRLVWSLNDTVNQFAQVASPDLVKWQVQDFPFLRPGQSFQKPVVQYDNSSRKYSIMFISGTQYFKTTTSDFKTYEPSAAIPASMYKDDRTTVNLPVGSYMGKVIKVPLQVLTRLNDAWQQRQYKANQAKESPRNDSVQFANLKPLTASITLQPEKSKSISDLLVGVFFEDINYSADGGLYAELVQNRDFEYEPVEKLNRDKNWNYRYAWSTQGNLNFSIDTVSPLHPNNPHYAVLDVKQPGGVFVNGGYDGIPVKQGEIYYFSMFAKNSDEKGRGLLVKLVTPDGSVLAQAAIRVNGSKWVKYNVALTAKADAKDANLQLQPLVAGRVSLDMVSLFPQKTLKNRKNGLRADLAETIAAIQPKFIRFPGGCVAHGDGIENMYRWKNSIGPLESRKPQPNIWRYHQSVGLGYFEYFQYCEDIGAVPLPIIPAGVPCQNSGMLTGEMGQHGGIPMNEMDEYIQDIMDLIEWANGPANSKWGKLRAAAGHPAPFNLKYVGIGNEDMISEVFKERFAMIYKALQQKHPEIKVIGTTGPFQEGADYEEGWAFASKLDVPLVDEHYYESPGWFINNPDFYDHYDRGKPKVYLGEYASRGNTWFNALAEALYLTNIERNGDVVQMTSYAPLLAKEKYTQWNPDMIYFNNTEVKPTVNYEVQKLFGTNAGDEYLPATLKLSNEADEVKKRLGVSVVRNSKDGSIIVKLVNMLPAATSVKFDLGNVAGVKATKSVLHGSPNDRMLPVKFTQTSVTNVLEEVLPPYSLTVWKIEKRK